MGLPGPLISEQGTVRVRFLHSSLHILWFDICIDWQEEKTNDKTGKDADRICKI